MEGNLTPLQNPVRCEMQLRRNVSLVICSCMRELCLSVCVQGLKDQDAYLKKVQMKVIDEERCSVLGAVLTPVPKLFSRCFIVLCSKKHVTSHDFFSPAK